MGLETERMSGGGRKEELRVLTMKNSGSAKMSDPPSLADSNKSWSRLRLWRNAQHRHRHRSKDCSTSLSRPPNKSHRESERSTLHDIKEEDIATIENVDSPSLSKPRGSMKIRTLKDIFLCSRHGSGCREKARDESPPISSYAKLHSSPSSYKEKKRASPDVKLVQKKTLDSKTVYKSSPSRRGVPVSAHELHYIANRAQSEELRRKTFLPYRQGVLACLGIPSPSRQGHMVQPLY